ncbi:MAG: META domain-containing protein [Gemmatimonadaceae bacterium]|jgi:heat shock protein HslJ|nr:META domain-containing protein [Gemmatimonadaceae bacterium]
MRAVALSLALLTTMACAPKPDDPTTPSPSIVPGGAAQATGALDGEWRLARLAGSTIPADIPPVQWPSLRFDAKEGAVAGAAGVNRYRAQYQRTGTDGITLSPGAMTRMAGMPEAMELESKYVAMLDKVRRFRMDNGQLVFLGEDGAELARYSRAP